MPGKAPQVGPIVDVEGRAQTMFARQSQGFQHGGGGFGVGQMGAGGDDRPRLGDQGFRDVVFAERHIGAVFAIKDQGELLFIAYPQQNKGGQAFRIGLDAAHIDAFARQFFADEAAHVFIANPCDQGRFQPQTRGAGGHVGRAAAEIFLKRRHIFQPTADLRAVQVDRGAADCDHIQRFGRFGHGVTPLQQPRVPRDSCRSHGFGIFIPFSPKSKAFS